LRRQSCFSAGARPVWGSALAPAAGSPEAPDMGARGRRVRCAACSGLTRRCGLAGMVSGLCRMRRRAVATARHVISSKRMQPAVLPALWSAEGPAVEGSPPVRACRGRALVLPRRPVGGRMTPAGTGALAPRRVRQALRGGCLRERRARSRSRPRQACRSCPSRWWARGA